MSLNHVVVFLPFVHVFIGVFRYLIFSVALICRLVVLSRGGS